MSDDPRAQSGQGPEVDPLFDPELDAAPEPAVDLGKRPDLREALAEIAVPFDRGPNVASEARVHVGPTALRAAHQKTLDNESVRVAERVDPRRMVTQRIEAAGKGEARREAEAAVEVPGSERPAAVSVRPRRRAGALALVGMVGIGVLLAGIALWRRPAESSPVVEGAPASTSVPSAAPLDAEEPPPHDAQPSGVTPPASTSPASSARPQDAVPPPSPLRAVPKPTSMQQSPVQQPTAEPRTEPPPPASAKPGPVRSAGPAAPPPVPAPTPPPTIPPDFVQ